jgi:hypothetical protein
MMTPEEHKQRHIELHRALDELLAYYIAAKQDPYFGKRPLSDFLEWSYRQTQAPDERHG